VDLGLSGDVAVVIGGANGIGWAIARAFAAEHAQVAVVDRDPRTSQKTLQLADEFAARSLGLIADVTKYDQMCEACHSVAERLGSPRHVVFAAGAGSGKYGFPFWDLVPADWPRVLEINILGAVHTAHAFADELRQAAPATLLLISSVAGQIGSQTDPPYSAAKAAILNFAECAAKDFAPYNVRVNTICPGMIRTDLNRAVFQSWLNKQPADCQVAYGEWAAEKIQRIAPLGRWQTPDEVAAVAVFLASGHAANITGQAINVDGGQVMHW
jgi:NAD(P)-dependent dehydrogenase (short-subunit alcohol dehydrogenase family)